MKLFTLLCLAAAIPAAAFLHDASAQDNEPVDVIGLCRLLSDQDLWSGPSTNYKKIKRAESGSLLEIIGEKGNYFRVCVPDGFSCFIHTDFIIFNDEMLGTVTGNRVNLRSIPSTKGDYPIFQINSGYTLRVWERNGEWVKVEAPPEAYVYVLKTEVAPVPGTAEILDELAQQRSQGRRAWEEHFGNIREKKALDDSDAKLRVRFRALEESANKNFDGKRLDDVRAEYHAIAEAVSDELVKTVSLSRIREIDTLLAQSKLKDDFKEREKRMRLREEEWRRELRKMEEKEIAGTGEKKVSLPLPVARKGLVLLGRVDASGSRIILRGGKFKDSPLYTISCPDRRYRLKDFHGKRIAVRGAVGKMVTGELPSMVVERIEILR